MRKALRILMFLNLFFNSNFGWALTPGEVADDIIIQSHKKARQDAITILDNDFKNTMFLLAAQLQKNQSGFDNQSPMMSAYDRQVVSISQILGKILRPDIREEETSDATLIKYLAEYKAAMRSRFALSFVLDDQVYAQSAGIDAMENITNQFENLCSSGRSEKGLSYPIPLFANVPSVDIDVFLGWDSQKGNSANVNTASAGPRSSARDTLKVGKTGAIAIAGAAPNPVTIAVAVILTTLDGYFNIEDQLKLGNENSTANARMFQSVATDRDISRYYVEECKTISPLIQRIRRQISDLRGPDQDRENAISNASLMLSAIHLFDEDALKVVKARNFINLFNVAQRGFCKNLESQNTAMNSDQSHVAVDKKARDGVEVFCVKSSSEFTLMSDSTIKLPIESEGEKKFIIPFQKEVQDFAFKYPREKQIDIFAARLTLVLGPLWTQTIHAYQIEGLQEMDTELSSAFNKIQNLISVRDKRLKKTNIEDTYRAKSSKNGFLKELKL